MRDCCHNSDCSKDVDRMNKDSKKPLRVRFCPECKSVDVGFVFRIQNLFGILPRVECYDCGHSGADFPLLVTTKGELHKRSKKSTKKTRKGRGKK